MYYKVRGSWFRIFERWWRALFAAITLSTGGCNLHARYLGNDAGVVCRWRRQLFVSLYRYFLSDYFTAAAEMSFPLTIPHPQRGIKQKWPKYQWKVEQKKDQTRASFSSYFKVSSIHTFTKKLEKKWSLCSSFQIHREVESEGYQQAASCVSLLLIHPTPLLRSLSTFDFHALCIHLILKLGFNLPQFVFADLDSNLKISGRSTISERFSNSHGQYVLYVQHNKPSSVESDIIYFISDLFPKLLDITRTAAET